MNFNGIFFFCIYFSRAVCFLDVCVFSSTTRSIVWIFIAYLRKKVDRMAQKNCQYSNFSFQYRRYFIIWTFGIWYENDDPILDLIQWINAHYIYVAYSQLFRMTNIHVYQIRWIIIKGGVCLLDLCGSLNCIVNESIDVLARIEILLHNTQHSGYTHTHTHIHVLKNFTLKIYFLLISYPYATQLCISNIAISVWQNVYFTWFRMIWTTDASTLSYVSKLADVEFAWIRSNRI